MFIVIVGGAAKALPLFLCLAQLFTLLYQTKHTMKNILTLLALILTMATGCQKDCDQFHKGKTCTDEIRETYTGTYSGLLTGGGISDYTTIQVAVPTATSARILQTDIGRIELITETEFTLPQQTLTISGENYSITGTGAFTLGTLDIDFALDKIDGIANAVNYHYSGTKP